MKVRNRLENFEFILEDERGKPDEEVTTWTLKGLPYDLQVSLQQKMDPVMKLPGKAFGKGKNAWQKAMDDADVEMHVSGGRTELEYEILKHGLVSVSNLIDEDAGEEVEYPGMDASDKVKKKWYAEWLPRDVRVELSNAITEGSALDEDDTKN